jgi:hypothetical protein
LDGLAAVVNRKLVVKEAVYAVAVEGTVML